MKKYYQYLFILLSLLITKTVFADISIPMNFVTKESNGKNIGTITVQQTKYGVLFIPHLIDLTPGIHGFHIHQNPSCAENGNAAGGHLDPQKTGKHLGPYDKGHLGDLPPLFVNKDGKATLPLLAPRLKLTDIKNHSLMIHAGGENYSDQPAKLGGGGERLVCGVIK